jgi:hypothetical protein
MFEALLDEPIIAEIDAAAIVIFRPQPLLLPARSAATARVARAGKQSINQQRRINKLSLSLIDAHARTHSGAK